MNANPGTPERVRRDPGDITVAVLLAIGACIERARAPRGAWIAAVPIIIVNYVAFRAQLRFWQAQLGPADAILLSVALESVAIYWAWLAHQALVADDSALRPKLAAYGIALIIGALNYSHYCKPGWKPTAAAVAFGGMSAISPWMWAAYSRRVSRPVLKLKKLIEDHAVRLGITRWFWHAYRCVRVTWTATWTGENRPAEAIALYEARRAGKLAARGEGKPANITSPAGNSPAGKAPSPPGPPSRKGAAPGGTPRREARTSPPAVTDSLSDLQRAVLAELLADPGRELPSYRELSQSKFGLERSRRAARVLELAKAARNGHGGAS